MWTRQRKKTRRGALIVPAISVAFLAYFGFHALHGEYGFYAKERLDKRIAELQAELDAKHAQRLELEQRVQLLHDGTLEKDMLDEQARKALNVAHADEVVIYRSAARGD